MDFSAYEKGNPFMSYNHIQICKVDPDCCVERISETDQELPVRIRLQPFGYEGGIVASGGDQP